MDALWIMLKNVLMFVAYALPGFILVKSKLLKTNESLALSKILTYVGMPFLILSSTIGIDLTGTFIKTTGLVARLGFMITYKGINPKNILAMIYTKAATVDKRERFSSMFGEELSNKMEFRTINDIKG